MKKKYQDFLESIWMTHTKKRIKIKDLKDTHLANIIDFLKDMSDNKLSHQLIRLAVERGLTDKFLDRAQIPYKNENGNWEIYTKENRFEEISSKKEI